MRSSIELEFVNQATLEWDLKAGISTDLSDPCKPWQNGADESFNGNLLDEYLMLEWFRSRKASAEIT